MYARPFSIQSILFVRHPPVGSREHGFRGHALYSFTQTP